MITKREGLMLYWCEGDKFEKGKYKVAVTAADVRLLQLFKEWLNRYYSVKEDSIRLRLHIWEDTDEELTKRYWSKKLNVSLKSFTKSDIRKSGKNKRYPYGICRISIDSKKILQKILYDIRSKF